MKYSLKLFWKQKKQYIADIFEAKVHEKFRGFIHHDKAKCNNCRKCIELCPVGAINSDYSVDLGKCQFCNECVLNCREKALSFSNFHHTAATSREALVIPSGMTEEEFAAKAIEVKEEIVRIFGRSLKLRNVSAGGCNGCELELNATGNVNFDIGRYGIDIVASPRHADGVIVTGPMSENMAFALENTLKAVPDPKIIVLMGSCAISGGVFAESSAINREFLKNKDIALYIPGCPAHPLTVAVGILNILGRKSK